MTSRGSRRGPDPARSRSPACRPRGRGVVLLEPQVLRHRLGRLGRLGTPLLTLQIPLRLGIGRDALRPVEAVKRARGPVLVLGGAADELTPVEETRPLFEAAPEPKELWLVEGAGHADLHRFAGARYEEKVGSFLEKTLRAP